MAVPSWRSSRISFDRDGECATFLVQEVRKKGNADVFLKRKISFSEDSIAMVDFIKQAVTVATIKFSDIISFECNFAKQSYSV